MFLSVVHVPDVPIYTVHQHLWAYYPPKPPKAERPFLFRFFGERKALLLSAVKPLMPSVDLTDRIESGRVYAFDALLNPTEAKGGKKIGLFGNEARQDWLRRKLHGCDVRFVQVFDREPVHFIRGDGDKVTFAPARFTGAFQVTDKTLFLQTMAHGVGRAKAWGCGLIYLPEVMDAVLNDHR